MVKSAQINVCSLSQGSLLRNKVKNLKKKECVISADQIEVLKAYEIQGLFSPNFVF